MSVVPQNFARPSFYYCFHVIKRCSVGVYFTVNTLMSVLLKSVKKFGIWKKWSGVGDVRTGSLHYLFVRNKKRLKVNVEANEKKKGRHVCKLCL